MRMVRWAMGVSLLEHRINKKILEEARVAPIAMVMRRRMLEWFGYIDRRNETEKFEQLEGKRTRGRQKLSRILSGGT